MAASELAPVMLVAGGTGSVGAEVAREAAAQGWRVIVQGRDAAKLSELVARLGAPADFVVGDVAQPDAAQTIVAAAAAKFGRIDAVIDCVSTGPREGRLTGLFKDTTPEHYAAFYDLSAAWFQRLAHAAYPHLAERGGTLVGFISDAGKFAAPRQTIVGAARAAEIGFVRNLAVEAARDGIRVHAIAPSYVLESRTAALMGSERMETAAKRAGLGLPTAADIAPMTVFLCGPGAAKITGQIISVNGGLNA
ncbi:SDR family NAD(P)-dependent oxidoreductase [Novosphingobium sp. JCM 18896]|uniref:SDR family NAD(P)-dependent oxidoreductase n=1 Tax=Novosphingobium sp. JCM 18896 TaxID=2989731 RepID=UPI002223523D|nr:SDR family oxidoreductase [Novosphingobium sp. JCM 18896]MCW1429740.1 SDR family oxidoreductase [Novosphingobium sp. JCM 18896]